MLLTTHRPNGARLALSDLNLRLVRLGVPTAHLYRAECQRSDRAPIRPTPTSRPHPILPHPILGRWDDTGEPAATTDGHIVKITGGPTRSATHTLVAAVTDDTVIQFTSDPDGERQAGDVMRVPAGLYVCRNDTGEGPRYVAARAESLFDRTGIPVEVASACARGMLDVIGAVGIVRPTHVAVTGLLRATLALADGRENPDEIYDDVIDVMSLGVSRPDLIRRCSQYGDVGDEYVSVLAAVRESGYGRSVGVASGWAQILTAEIVESAVARRGG